ncbi:tetratricopeptide repeat protein 1, partial [Colletotrichum higginsianum]
MAPTEAEKEPQEKGKNKSVKEDEVDEAAAQERFSPEEEASLLAESNANKTEANALFSSSKYEQAITKYDDAVATCPNYLDYELAVLRSNISACHLKLEQWKDAVSSASAALDALDRVDKEAALEQDRRDREKAADEDVEDEI